MNAILGTEKAVDGCLALKGKQEHARTIPERGNTWEQYFQCKPRLMIG
jgi:hypothetical protein